MKNLFATLFIGAALGVVAHAQTSRFPPINLYNGDPTGNACTAPLIQQSSTTGKMYTCQSGHMNLSTGAAFNGGVVTNPITAPNFTLTGCPAGQVIKGDGTGCVALTAGTAAGSSKQVQFNSGGNFGADSVYTYDSTLHSLSMNNSQPALTPWSDIRSPAYAGLCNGSNADETAVQAAINAAQGAGGSGVVYIPDGCHLTNASGLTNPSPSKNLMIEMQGTLTAGSTFVVPVGASIKCLGKGIVYQFANGTPSCTVVAPQARGTLGTAIVSTNALVTVTPNFGLGGIGNLPVGSAITIAGYMTCATSGAVRTALGGTYPGAGPTNTTFTVTTCVDSSGNAIAFGIPPASKLTITNCSDSTFNTPTGGLFSNFSDFPAKTIGVRQVGAGATIADTSCVISGLNRDSWDTARVEAQSGSTISIRVNHVHAASDLWGEVGASLTLGDRSQKLIEGLGVTSNWGVGMWLPNNVTDYIVGASFTGLQYLTSTAFEESSGFGLVIDKSQTTSFSGYTCPTISFNCGDIGPPWTMIFDMLPQSLITQNAIASVQIGPNDFIRTGIYITPNGSATAYENGPIITDSVIEEPMWNAITFDNRGDRVSAIYGTTLDNVLMQDNIVQWSQASFEGMTDSVTSPTSPLGQINFINTTNMAFGPTANVPPATTVNKYFCGQVSVNGAQGYNNLVYPACPEATISFNDGRSFVGENATPAVGPTYIPGTTLAVSPTWGCTNVTGSGCTVTNGQADPWGGTSAAVLFAGTGFATSSGLFTYTGTTATGDKFLYGFMSRATDGLSFPTMGLTTFGGDQFDLTNSINYSPAVQNLYWHSTVAMAIVTSGSGASHSITFQVSPSLTTPGTTAYFASPFVIKIPASSNIPTDEIRRWRATTLHGYVPPSFTGPGFAAPPSTPWSISSLLANTTQAATIYSAAGTALPTCNAAAKGTSASVSDATAPTYGANYTSGGAVVSRVLCNGTNWTTQ